MRFTAPITALVLLTGAEGTPAQPVDDPSQVPVSLRSVQWLSHGVRILLFPGGFEHVLSRVTIQWLSVPSHDADQGVLATRDLAIGMSSCDAPIRISANRFSIACTDVHGPEEGKSRTYTVQVGGPGVYSVLRR